MAVKIEQGRWNLTAGAVTTQDLTIPGFGDVKAAIFFSMNEVANNTQGTGSKYQSYGFAEVGGSQGVTTTYSGTGVSESAERRYQDESHCIVHINSVNTIGSASVQSFITDGVRLSIDDDFFAARFVHAIFIGGSGVGSTSVGAQSFGATVAAVPVSIGFEPTLVFSTTVAGGTTGASFDQTRQSFGCAYNDGASVVQRATAISATTGEGQSECNSIIIDTGMGAALGSDNITWTYSASNFNPDGFSVTCTSSTTTANHHWLAIEFTEDVDLALFSCDWPTAGSKVETQPGFPPTFGLINTQAFGTYNTLATQWNYAVSVAAFDANSLHTANWTDKDAAGTMDTGQYSSNSLRIIDQDKLLRISAASVTLDPTGWTFPLTINPPVTRYGWALAFAPAAASGTKEMYIKDGGIFVKYTPHVKVGGTFQEVDAYVLDGGAWVPVHEK